MSTATKPSLREKLESVNEEIAGKQSTLQERWQAFEQARDEFASAGEDANKTDSDAFKKAEDEHKRYALIAGEIKELEGVRDGIFRMMAGEQPVDPSQPQVDPTPSDPESKSLGERAGDSEAYKRLKESGVLDSHSAAFGSVPLAKATMPETMATLLTGVSDTSAGAFIVNEEKQYVPQPRRRRTILDLITTGQTGSDTVEFARQTTFTNVAAETAEATATSTGTKPEATIAFEKVTAAVKQIAHWVPATRRSLADVPQLRTLIDSQLRYGLEYRLESEVVNGDGTGENLTGIINTSNILSQAQGTDSTADAIHKAITQIRLGFVEPNGVALHPNDWQVLRLSRDGGGSVAGSGAYLYGPPSTAGSEQIWGLPVAVTAAVPDDTGLVGDFTQAVLWLREGMQVLASDSHESFFIKNLVALLAELRAAFGVLLPAAFCKVTSVN